MKAFVSHCGGIPQGCVRMAKDKQLTKHSGNSAVECMAMGKPLVGYPQFGAWTLEGMHSRPGQNACAFPKSASLVKT